MLPLLVVGIIAVWWLHLTQSLTDRARYYIYAVMIYILLFFHGIHQTSLFDVAITTNLSILLFSQINDEKVIKAGVGVYASVLAYQLVLAPDYGVNLCVDVIDTGIGISSDEMGRIKQGFYQTDGGRNRKAGGIGLGMPIVYGFVHCMNGFVKIDSREGQGTKVHVSIPQGVADPTQCIAVENAGNLCIACFLSPEKYKHPAIRDYYAEMISDMVKGLKVNLHRIAKIEDLQKVYKAYDVTHVFTGLEEYMATPSYFEEIAENTKVTVVADYSFELPAKTKLSLIRKLFYALPVAAVLNYADDAQNLNDETDYGKIQPVFEGVKVLMLIPLCLRYYTAMR